MVTEKTVLEIEFIYENRIIVDIEFFDIASTKNRTFHFGVPLEA